MQEAQSRATVAVARHGETTWNVAGRYQGKLESDLSERGVAQAECVASAFARRLLPLNGMPTRIVSSPLRRCRNTAMPLAQALGLPVEIDDRLIEIGHGSWEGLLRDEIAAKDPERYAAWRSKPASVRFEGGESLADVAARWSEFATELAARDEVTVVVTHDAVVRIALLLLQRRPLDDLWGVPVENAAFARLERRDGSLQLIDPSYTDHLASLRSSIEGQAL